MPGKVLLIDVDSTIPNLALMKVSYWYKLKGFDVSLIKCNIPYYPHRRKGVFRIDTSFYDVSLASSIFFGSRDYIEGDIDAFGGSGFSLSRVLPNEIEYGGVDYSIYPDNDTSYGFITRGCIRKCRFCIVPKKEGYIRKCGTIYDIIKHDKVCFLDNNILAYKDAKKVLAELVNLGVKCQFKQGFDLRLCDVNVSYLLRKLNYLGDYIFAFDNIKDFKIIKEKLSLFSWRWEDQFKFYVYVSKDTAIRDAVFRVNFLKKEKCLAYLMRDVNCWDVDSVNKNFWIDFAAYCNQPAFFKKMSFSEFMDKRTNNIVRRDCSINLYRQAGGV